MQDQSRGALMILAQLVVLALRPLISASRKICRLWRAPVRLLPHDADSANAATAAPCGRCAGALERGDVEAVMARLGIAGWAAGAGGGCPECEAVEAAEELAAAGEAAEGELEEAFYVFDRNEDGFICAAEVWGVLRRLGLGEGGGEVRYEDCKRMVAAFDEDGDGRISFREFRTMMETAV